MTLKILFVSLLILSTTYEAVAEPNNKVKEQTQLAVWTPAIPAKPSGKSCENGNCFKKSNCLTKDGPLPKCITKMVKRMKKHCNKL